MNTDYVLTVTDAMGCARKDTVNVRQQQVVVASVTAANCFGSSTGSATASVTSGNPPYTYSWSTTPVQTGTSVSSLSPGTYTVTATDSRGCTGTNTFTITAPPQLVASIVSSSNVDCNGGTNGSA